MATYPSHGVSNYDTLLRPYIDEALWCSIKSPTFGATGNGTTDDTAAFSAAIASGVKNLFAPPGTYIVSTLTMNQAGQSLTIAPGATIKAKPGGGAGGAVIIVSATGVTISGGGTIDGNSVYGATGHGVYTTVADTTVSGLSFVNCAGHCVTSNGGDRVTVDANRMTSPGAEAIVCTTNGVALTAPRVTNNRISLTAVGPYGIQVYGQGGFSILRPQVSGNDVTLPAGSTSGICIEARTGVVGGTVSRNTTTGGSMGVSFDTCTATTATGNNVFGPTTNGMELVTSVDCAFSGNTVDGNAVTGTAYILSNTGGGDNALTGNTFRNLSTGAGTGIRANAPAGTRTAIVGNVGTANVPIVAASASGLTITGNILTIDGTSAACIFLDTCTDSVVSQNVCSGATTGAVNVFSGTMNGIVVGPNICTGGTPAVDMAGGWTPGTNGTGSRVIRGNATGVYGLATQTVGASPWTFTNTARTPMTVYVRAGTVSNITMGGFSLATASPATLWLNPGESIIVTYSVAPTVNTYTQ